MELYCVYFIILIGLRLLPVLAFPIPAKYIVTDRFYFDYLSFVGCALKLLYVTDIRIVHVFVLSYTPYFHIVE